MSNSNGGPTFFKNKLPANIQKLLCQAAADWDNDDLDWQSLKKGLVDFISSEEPTLRISRNPADYILNRLCETFVECSPKSDENLKFVFDPETGRACKGSTNAAACVMLTRCTFEVFCYIYLQHT